MYAINLSDARRQFINKIYVSCMKAKTQHKQKESLGPLPQRWVIESSFSWLNYNRRLCTNYELLLRTAEEMTKFSTIKLLLNKI